LPDLLRHVRTLADEIGPRCAARARELETAGYIVEAAKGYTHQVWTEPFPTYTVSLWQWFLFLCLALAGGLALWWQPAVALVLTALAAGCIAARAPGRNRGGWPLRRRMGQNVVTVVPSLGAIRERVVLIAHYDTGRQLSEAVRADRFQAANRLLVGSVPALPLLALAGLVAPHGVWAWIGLAPVLGIVGAAALSLGPAATGSDPGATGLENASGVTAALQAAEAAGGAPLRHTEIWAVFTGCKQASMAGLHAFLDRHGRVLADAQFIVLDRVAAGGLCYSLGEGGLPHRRADADLVGIVREAAAAHPEWGVGGIALRQARTEAYTAQARGHRAMALMGAGGLAGPDRVDRAAVDRAVALVRAVAERVDRRACQQEEESVG
jgi:hypothetical protein